MGHSSFEPEARTRDIRTHREQPMAPLISRVLGPDMQGGDVRSLQQSLVLFGIPVADAEQQAAAFGATTGDAVRASRAAGACSRPVSSTRRPPSSWTAPPPSP